MGPYGPVKMRHRSHEHCICNVFVSRRPFLRSCCRLLIKMRHRPRMYRQYIFSLSVCPISCCGASAGLITFAPMCASVPNGTHCFQQCPKALSYGGRRYRYFFTGGVTVSQVRFALHFPLWTLRDQCVCLSYGWPEVKKATWKR